MVVEIKHEICDGYLLKWLHAAGMAWLEHNRERVNELNVFPVPDGDTGTNMCLTMQKAYDAIARMDESHVGIVSEHLANGALRGARGNSGVILSQLLRGFASTMRGHEVFDVPLLAQGCHSAVDAAYKAVMQPTEGTILTVARNAAEAVTQYAKSHADLAEALDILVEAARTSLATTPDLLPVLKKAGVVDSGGQGLVFILEGMSRLIRGEPVYTGDRKPMVEGEENWQAALEPEDELGYGYDVQFLMRGENMKVNAVRDDIDAMGWSTLVVGDERLIKVHVHVHDPGIPLSYAIRSGAEIDDIVVENMQAQYEQYVEHRRKRYMPDEREIEGVAVITVASGDGLRTLFEEGLGAAHVISGGQTMNPSADDFIRAINALKNDEIVLLPNNRNIIMAAQQAAEMAEDKTVRVIPTVTIPQGISAMLVYIDVGATDSLDEVVDAMREAARYVVTAEITTAIRDAHVNDINIRQGQMIGLVDDNLVSVGDTIEAVARDVLWKAGADERELVTLYYGDGLDQSEAQRLVDGLSVDFPGQTFEIVYGGQPLYPYIISVE